MYRKRRLQRSSAVLFVWRFDDMTATLLHSWNLCSVFRARGFRKDKILDVNHTDASSWKCAICLDGLLNGTTWLSLRFFLRCFSLWFGPGVFFPAEYFRHLALLLMGCYGITIESLRDGAIFFWRAGGKKNPEKICLQNPKSPTKLFAGMKSCKKKKNTQLV